MILADFTDRSLLVLNRLKAVAEFFLEAQRHKIALTGDSRRHGIDVGDPAARAAGRYGVPGAPCGNTGRFKRQLMFVS